MIELLKKYLYFIVIYAVFLVFIFSLTLFIKRKNKTNYHLYGLLMNMKNNEIFALSLIALNFIFLSYILIFKIELNLAIILVSLILIITSFALVLKPKSLIIDLLINFVNLAVIYLANLINTLKLNQESTKIYLFLQIIINVFGLFFYIFTHLKFLKDIRKDSYEKNN